MFALLPIFLLRTLLEAESTPVFGDHRLEQIAIVEQNFCDGLRLDFEAKEVHPKFFLVKVLVLLYLSPLDEIDIIFGIEVVLVYLVEIDILLFEG